LLTASFPPGSVTGAPKVAAQHSIAQLETQARGAYTGAIGFASPSWGLHLSVAIRTFEIDGAGIELGVGGGITADSVPMAEWRECLDKAAPMLAAMGSGLAARLRTPVVTATAEQLRAGVLETMLARDGSVMRLAEHLARMDRSLRELYGVGLPADVPDRVRAECAVGAPRVVRVIAGPDPAVVSSAELSPRPTSCEAVCTERPNGLWRHKWADRSVLSRIEAESGSRTPLLLAPDGTVLETTRGNVFLLDGDVLVTPPLRDDVLPGVTRRALLDLAADQGLAVELREFGVEEMLAARACFWTSSLSGLVTIRSIDGVATATGVDGTATATDVADLAALRSGLGFWSIP
jgi:para-aminobenzoate synthetase/4-amino-4-deoxychorismate lyase